jgi:hypothetical protein
MSPWWLYIPETKTMEFAPTLAASARISKTRRIQKEAKSHYANKTSFLVAQSQLIEFANIEFATPLFFERQKEIEFAPQVQSERRQ